jgi:hypothetical protein
MKKKILIQTTKKTINTILVSFTLAKFTSAFVTIIVVAMIKYIISGNFHIEYSEFWNNVAIGLYGWTINTACLTWFSKYFGIKGFNFNLKQFFFGYDTMGAGDSPTSKDFKPKLYNAMESDDVSDPSKQIDKGKGIDKGYNGGNDESEAKSMNEGNSDVKSLKDDVDYWQLQTINYTDILKTFYKPKHLWTRDEWALVAEQERLGQYNILKIEEYLKENRRNLSTSIKELKAKGISDASTLGKHSPTSLSQNLDTKRAFKND